MHSLSWQRMERSRLREAALGHIGRGWPVAPGAYLERGHCSCHRRGACTAPGRHPVDLEWFFAATTARETVHFWWARHPYTVILPTGRAFDIVELPIEACRATVRHVAHIGPRGPVAVHGGRLWFWVRPRLRAEAEVTPLASGPHPMRYLAEGSYIAAPPSRWGEGSGPRWVVPPSACSGALPDAGRLLTSLGVAHRVGYPQKTLNLRGRNSTGTPKTPSESP
jgi:hypothetical protein